jgi:uridine phosphorylase
MDEFTTTSDNLDQADEDILAYTISDEELEAATDFGAGPLAGAKTFWMLTVICEVCPPPP